MGAENRVYDPWRRDLREAHKKAQLRKRKGSENIREPAQEPIATGEPSRASDEPRNSEALDFLVGEGLLVSKDGTIDIAPRLLHRLWIHSCDPAFISAITDPKQDLNSDECLMLKVMARLLILRSAARAFLPLRSILIRPLATTLLSLVIQHRT